MPKRVMGSTSCDERVNPAIRCAFVLDTNEENCMSKRELIDTGTDKRYVRRDEQGQFEESDDVGKSLSQDVRQHAKAKSKSGQGDRGDH